MRPTCCRVYFAFFCVGSLAHIDNRKSLVEVEGLPSLAEQHLPKGLSLEVDRPGTGGDPHMGYWPQARPYLLPVFQHAQGPVVSADVFNPVAGRRPFPSSLSSLLLPRHHDPLGAQPGPVRNCRGVEVSCGSSRVSVRVRRKLLGFAAPASTFRLGSCPVTRASPDSFYFRYRLSECGGASLTAGGRLLYSNTLFFTPEPQRQVLRAVPLSLPIQCQYNRFHYSYKIGYVPEVLDRTFLRSLRGQRIFTLTARNAQWQRLDLGESYVLGEPMYFEVTAQRVGPNEAVFVDSCHVTGSKDSASSPRLDVIENFGCMVDSMRHGSLSRFFSRGPNVLRFAVDAFLFPGITSEQLYLHCAVRVGSPVPRVTAKSCTYSNASNRWEELTGPPGACSCCDSKCEDADIFDNRHDSLSTLESVITSDPWTVVVREPSTLEAEMKTVTGSVTEVDDASEESEESGEGDQDESVPGEDTVEDTSGLMVDLFGVTAMFEP
ncbi:zona pellucida glycoprotein 3d tandem duplicate 1 [Denticeps clupeoides]|uniref:zona pellucida glycoprotein 3d tandem duplicate 1 n=1 Tax=Denticeps clupeoides TaxID=299321 RepID=UPI0010A53DE2|nr:zona pellucida sperm-binding protein 3-like [Denticeps clupeoides]